MLVDQSRPRTRDVFTSKLDVFTLDPLTIDECLTIGDLLDAVPATINIIHSSFVFLFLFLFPFPFSFLLLPSLLPPSSNLPTLLLQGRNLSQHHWRHLHHQRTAFQRTAFITNISFIVHDHHVRKTVCFRDSSTVQAVLISCSLPI